MEWLKDGEEDVDMSGGEEDLRGRLSLHKGFCSYVSLSKTSNRPLYFFSRAPCTTTLSTLLNIPPTSLAVQ